ncbi:phospholipid carrier-dependent glycosyltransferase [Candidatus Poribacteria bacterium]|nr:phospholipid carrier-dependent glycosyltransferase [Candidatus Poribacteria bacterium]
MITARRDYSSFATHVALLAFAAVYWGSYSNINAPFIYHADEPDVISRAARMALTGDLNPHWFHYPSLVIYAHAGILKLLQFLFDAPLPLCLPLSVRGVNPEVFDIYHTARIATVCFSLGTLYLILRLTSRMTSPLLASLAGLTFIGSNLVRESAAYVTLEMPMAFFVTASLMQLVAFTDSAERGQCRERHLWSAVIFGGLAAGSKYNGAAVLFAVPLAIWLVRKPFRWVLSRLTLAVLLSIAVFVVTTPYSILDIKTFLDPAVGMPYDFVHYSSGHPGADQGVSLFKAINSLLNQHSFLVLFALLSPLAAREITTRKPLALAGAASILFLGMVSTAKVYFPRHLLPSLPALCCLTAVGVWGAFGTSLSALERKRTAVRAKLPLIIVFVLAGWILFQRTRATWQEMRRPDNRTLAYEWITAAVPAGSRILYEAYCPQLYFAGKFRTGWAWTISRIPFEEIVLNYDYVVISEMQWPRYRAFGFRSYDPLFKFPLLREWPSEAGRSRGPAIRIYAISRNSDINRR